MDELFSIKEKKGIITGASGGIGSTLAKAILTYVNKWNIIKVTRILKFKVL